MISRLRIARLLLAATIAAAPLVSARDVYAGAKTASQTNPRVAIETSAGTIRVELFAQQAPITVANFLRYVDVGAYNGGSFFRTVRSGNQPASPVKIAVIQGGENAYYAQHEFPPIRLETTKTTGIHHLDGTISMARDTPNSATGSFFICIGSQPSLDYNGQRNRDGQGFGAFGRVISGMGVVRAIQQAHASGQTLVPPLRILRVVRS